MPLSDYCVICASPVQKDKGALFFVFEGQAFHFCSLDCLKIFQAYPNAYTHDQESELSSVEDSGF